MCDERADETGREVTIDYDISSDTLTIRWCGDHEDARWRMARANVDLLVDYANETSAVRIHSASHYAPDLDGASLSFQSQLNLAALSARLRRHYRPDTPWDVLAPPEPGDMPRYWWKGSRGICYQCGAEASSRHAPCKVSGWPMMNVCPRCFGAPGQVTERIEEPCEQRMAKSEERRSAAGPAVTDTRNPAVRLTRGSSIWMSPVSSLPVQRAEPGRQAMQSDSQRAER